MRLGRIHEGDVVEVNKGGRRFLALVVERDGRELTVQPVDSRLSYRHARAIEVVGHWRRLKRERSRAKEAA